MFDRHGAAVVVGHQLKQLERMVAPEKARDRLAGTVAYAGRARGKVRIVLNPFSAHDFQTGDVLVTGMTRPEFLPLMKKAAAFVTDAGGILSHAAITARELKKPCLIGTKIATKVLRDGDVVEVDATRGVVKLVKRG